MQFSDKQVGEFCHRSYHAVDGLWFMKVEEKFGFEAALELDNEVWKVLPKIQVRMLKKMYGVDGGLEALRSCLEPRLQMEGFEFRITEEGRDSVQVTVSRCPWHDAMLKSNRVHLSGRINSLVCGTEYGVWATEFGPSLKVSWRDRICTGGDTCRFEFRRTGDAC